MKAASIMIIAGDASGDERAAELVRALRSMIASGNASHTSDVQPLKTELEPAFFGAGGERMKAAGVEVAFDLTCHSIIGITRALRSILVFRRLFNQLFKLAIERQPDVIIGVDFGGLNIRLGRAIKNYARRHSGRFKTWNPKIVQYVSPQVWASRPWRAYRLAESHDLILSIIPFEREWYARRVPKLQVIYVGHPLVEQRRRPPATETTAPVGPSPRVLLLPGSRPTELRHHLGMMLDALKLMRARVPELRARMVIPNTALVEQAKKFGLPDEVEVQIGGITTALANADLAIAKTGTITMECAYFGVPTVTFYRLSWIEYQFAKILVKVKWVAMPNLLANEEVFPEFIQDRATAENVAAAALELLQNQAHREAVRRTLAKIITSLGGPGAPERAAAAIAKLLK